MNSKPPPEKLEGETNVFGGKNAHGLYVPMTETEQEVLSRLVESQDLEVVLHGWGILHNPKIIFGDYRLAIYMRVTFDAPALPVPVHYLDLELRTGSGMTLFKERQPTVVGGNPIQIAAGVSIDMVWDIAMHHIDPAIVKSIKPGAVGLTSRRLDKETLEPTFTGNMKLDSKQKRYLHQLEEGARRQREADKAKVIKVTRDAGEKIRP